MKDNIFKIIIVICIVAIVGILWVSAYYFVNNNNKAVAANQTIQNTTNAPNSTLNTTNQSKATQKPTTHVNLISAQRAIDIVEQSAPWSENCRFSAKLYKNNGAPYYLVTAYDNVQGSPTYGEGIGGAKVDARTGVILDEMG